MSQFSNNSSLRQFHTPLEKLRDLESHLHFHIKGQDHVIPRVVSVLKRGELNLAHPSRPRGSFLFVGPTGTGKTEITLTFSNYLFGEGKLFRFDMSEFQNQSSVGLLLGQSSTDNGLLGRILSKHDRGTILFDEMEKAHPLVLDLFLQILDAARITTSDGVTHSLSNFYVILTSNIGAAESMRMEHSSPATIERTVLRKVEQTLRPEFVARITDRIVFLRLTYEVQREIATLVAHKELARLKTLGYDLELSKEALEFLIRKGYDRFLGARPMRNTVERFVQDAIVKGLIQDNLEGTCIVDVDPGNEKLVLKTTTVADSLQEEEDQTDLAAA
ncbi:MAG: AAA family ATPase [Verrucomicrobiae bacterium]|nr:AAA family ATPase [Verrucomicrobiae bacterium]